MARKRCPACQRMTGASAATCAGCGHVFAAVEPVESRGVKRCLECGLVSPASARQCQCGAELDVDPAELRAILAERRSTGRGMIIGSLMLGVIGTAGFAAVAFVSGLLAAGGIAIVLGTSSRMYRKGSRILYAVRATSDELEGRGDALPQARLRE